MPITRTVSLPSSSSSRPAKKARKAAMPKKMSLGLRRYLDVRGTPSGTYELVRTTTAALDYTNAGIAIGLANYLAMTFVFTPSGVQLISSPSGNINYYNLVNAAEIAALWDKVKIDKVEITFTSSVIGTANTSLQQPLLCFAEDDNDTVTSADQILQMDCKTWSPGDNNNPFKITVRPKFTSLVYYTSVTSSYVPNRGYIQSGTDVPHYGLKLGFAQIGASGKLMTTFKFFLKCKELK